MKTFQKSYHHKISIKKAGLFLIFPVMLLFLSSCYEMTVQVAKLPGNTPSDDPIYIVGNFNNWDPGDSQYILQLGKDSVYEVSLPRGIGPLEYKFTRGDWTTVEKDICGFEIENRVLVYGRGNLVVDTIRSWNDHPPLDCPHITIVLDSLPGDTPEGSYLSLAGTFNGWDPSGLEWQFKLDSHLGKPVINLPRIGDTRKVELKVTRGSLERVESDALGKEIKARQMTFGDQDTVFIRVDGWEDLSRENKGNFLTVILSKIPANTPRDASIFITGDFNGWYPRQGDYLLEKNRQGQYFINLPKKAGEFGCKFTRGDWSTEEVDRWGNRINDRLISYNQDTVLLEIQNWRDLSSPVARPVLILLESLPAATPADAVLFIAGNFNNWNPGDNRYILEKTQDGKYRVEVPRSEYNLDFKITRGNWGTVECKTGGEDIENRSYPYAEVTEIRISVEAWKDRP